MIRRTLSAGALLALAACASATGPAPENATRAVAVPISPPALAERTAHGTCRTREVTPAVYEQVMGEVQVVQAQIADDGTVLNPPIYRRAPVPRLVRARSEISFEAPCPEVLTPEFIASLQRALAVRGYFAGNVTRLPRRRFANTSPNAVWTAGRSRSKPPARWGLSPSNATIFEGQALTPHDPKKDHTGDQSEQPQHAPGLKRHLA